MYLTLANSSVGSEEHDRDHMDEGDQRSMIMTMYEEEGLGPGYVVPRPFPWPEMHDILISAALNATKVSPLKICASRFALNPP